MESRSASVGKKSVSKLTQEKKGTSRGPDGSVLAKAQGVAEGNALIILTFKKIGLIS